MNGLDSGHPIIKIKNDIGDADEVLRGWLQQIYHLPLEMINDPNGSEHVVISTNLLEFAFYWGSTCDGNIFIRIEGDTTPDYFELKTVERISESEFQANF